jgi:pyruvate carboxylase
MITGVTTTIPLEQAILSDPNFKRGVYTTSFIEQLLSGPKREFFESRRDS